MKTHHTYNVFFSIWQVLFGAAPAGNMFQKQINELFSDIPKVFGIADDILVVGFSEDIRDNDER